MMRSCRALAAVIIMLLSGCATTLRHDPSSAAVADIVTTEYGLAHGARELNPLGREAAYVLKGIYLWHVRPRLDADSRANTDRAVASLWYAAAVNNVLQIVQPQMALGAVAVAGFVGWYNWSTPRAVQSVD
jgi:hypothetical protein